MSNLKHVADDEEFRSLLKTAGLDMVVVDFYTSWCGPCKQMEPLVQSLSMKYPSVLFLKVDADRCFEIAMQHNVKGVPLFIIYRNGEILDQIQGALPNELDQKISLIELEYHRRSQRHPQSSSNFNNLNGQSSEEGRFQQNGVMSSISVGRVVDVSKYLDEKSCRSINDLAPSSFDGFLDGRKLISGKGSGKLLLVYSFTQKLMLHSFKIQAKPETGPKVLRFFANHPKILDFNVGSQLAPSQEVTLSPDDLTGELAIELRAGGFNFVSNLQILITEGKQTKSAPGYHRVEIESIKIFGAPLLHQDEGSTLIPIKSGVGAGPTCSSSSSGCQLVPISTLKPDVEKDSKNQVEDESFIEEVSVPMPKEHQKQRAELAPTGGTTSDQGHSRDHSTVASNPAPIPAPQHKVIHKNLEGERDMVRDEAALVAEQKLVTKAVENEKSEKNENPKNTKTVGAGKDPVSVSGRRNHHHTPKSEKGKKVQVQVLKKAKKSSR